MKASDLRIASRMWRDGLCATTISKALGVKAARIYYVAERNRSMFPPRKRLKPADRRVRAVVDQSPVEKNVGTPSKPGTIAWTTDAGATVTLPDIWGVKCPRRGG